MDQFGLTVVGYEGAPLDCTVSFQGTPIADFTAGSLKEAERKARTEARIYLDSNTPLNKISVAKTFTL